jgi:hypothetical protein
MYIEFSHLPTANAWRALGVELYDWAAKYNITYRQKAFKLTLRVTFDLDESYTLFALTWNPGQNESLKYSLIEPMKTRQP